MLKIALGLAVALFPLSAVAQPVLEEIAETGELRVAVREDAPPFSYLDSGDNLRGYCLDFIELLEEKLTKELQRNTMAVTLLKSTVSNRFDLVENNLVALECGPNTIRELTSESAAFSRPFFVTGTQFLVATNRESQFELDGNLGELTIGVINNSSNQEAIAQRYPEAEIVAFSGTTARSRGVQAVRQGQIDAMVSDGILLWAEMAQQEFPKEEYKLIPQSPLTTDYYGMILPESDSDWQEFVNSVVVSPESQALFQRWFGAIASFPDKTPAAE